MVAGARDGATDGDGPNITGGGRLVYEFRKRDGCFGRPGRFVVRGGDYETREGTWQPQRIVILEFPDIATARAWYDSPEYQAILPIRQANSHCNFLTIVEGHDG